MNVEEEKLAAPKYMYRCFMLRGIVYVPHYTQPTWVGPGSDRQYTAQEMFELGASSIAQHLFKRKVHQEI